MTIEDKGMPFHKSPFRFGNLFIMFKVVYPDTMAPNQKETLLNAFREIDGMQLKSNKIE